MPAVLRGDTPTVDSILAHLQSPQANQATPTSLAAETAAHGTSSNQLHGDRPSGLVADHTPDLSHNRRRPSHTIEQILTDLTPPTKRVKITNLVPESAWHAANQDMELSDVTKMGTLSESDVRGLDFDAEMPVVSSVGVASGCGMEVLWELTEQNCNILHVCGRLDGGGGGSSKGKGEWVKGCNR